MTTVTLAPLVKQQFNQNGIPLAGGKLFVYNAGTTTKALTYTDATGDTPNTNPIILDANGQCGVWLLPTLAYKFILSPATDTDPPTNPFWTVDNVTTVQGVAVGDMTDEKGSGGTYGFAANVDFTPGTTTQLTLSQNYGSSGNLWVTFDGTEQGADTFSLGGTNNTVLTFNAPIPVGVQKVYVKGGTALTIGTPGAGTVGDAQINQSSNLYIHAYSFVGSKDVGALGNGTTDDHTAVQNAGSLASSSGKLLLVTPGTYLIGSSIAFAGPVEFMPGAQFVVKSGAVVTFNGQLTGPLTNIFSVQTGGNIVVNPGTTTEGYPEWFGAQPGNSSFDCAPYINASLSVFSVTRLQNTVYYTATSVLMGQNGQSLVGSNPNLTQGAFNSSVIQCQSAAVTILQIGPNVNPYPASLQTSMAVHNVAFSRGTAPDISQSATGIKIQYCSGVLMKCVSVIDSVECFHQLGSAYVRYEHCNAFKLTVGINGTDAFHGFNLDGSAYIGFSDSGNPSVLMYDCQVSNLRDADTTWAPGSDYQGMFVHGQYGWSDVWIFDLETNGVGTGINLVGTVNNTTTADSLNKRFYVYNPILDTCVLAGISFTNISSYGDIHVIGGYANCSNAQPNPVGISYSSSNGNVQISQFMVECNKNHSTIGVVSYASSKMVHRDCSYLEAFVTPIQLNSTSHFTFMDQVTNDSSASSNVAFLVNNCNRGYMNIALSGYPGAYGGGIDLADTSIQYCEFACSRMDPGAITGGVKVVYNGTPITTAGTFGTGNLASGIMN
jgi:hypothetical protein